VSLEEDIKQKRPFNDEAEKVIVNVMYTNNWMVDNLRLRLKSFGMTRSQYNILRILAGAEGPLTTSKIRSRMLEKMSDISRLIDRMIGKGWVSKKVSSTDRRLVDIQITDTGKTQLAQVNQQREPLYSFAQALSKTEAENLNFLLDKLRGSLT